MRWSENQCGKTPSSILLPRLWAQNTALSRRVVKSIKIMDLLRLLRKWVTSQLELSAIAFSREDSAGHGIMSRKGGLDEEDDFSALPLFYLCWPDPMALAQTADDGWAAHDDGYPMMSGMESGAFRSVAPPSFAGARWSRVGHPDSPSAAQYNQLEHRGSARSRAGPSGAGGEPALSWLSHLWPPVSPAVFLLRRRPGGARAGATLGWDGG